MNGQETPWTPGVGAAPDADAAADPEHLGWAPPLGEPRTTQPTTETLLTLATPRAPALPTPGEGAGAPAAGVGTLRAILLGNNAPAEQPARLAAIERRLDELAAQLERTQAAARGGDVTLASLANLQQQVADLRQRAETVPIPREHAPAADELAELRRQVEDLRRGQAHQTGAFMEELRQTEARCLLRQRRARSANRMELAALRRRVYAPQTLRRTNAALPTREPVHAIPLAQASYASARPAPHGAAAQPARSGGRRVAPRTGAEAWGEVWHTLVAFLAAVWAVIALLGRMLGEDLKDAWIGLGELLRRG
jgi:hypothetical protein